MENSKIVKIYTDGACKGNPGIGGWGALLEYNGQRKELFGGEKYTTNNRMELLATIRALESLQCPTTVQLFTDSQYVQKGISEWICTWKTRNWQTSNKKPVKNADLWKQLDRLSSQHQVKWIWVRGHAGHAGNEQADRLANRGAAMFLSGNQ